MGVVGKERRFEPEELAAFLRRHSRTAAGPLARLPGNGVLPLLDGRAVVGYRRMGRVLLTVGEPVAEPGYEDAALGALLDYCRDRGLRPALVGVDGLCSRQGRARGMRALKVAEEAWVPLAEFTLDGRARRRLRQAVNRVRRDGVRVHKYDDGYRTDARDRRLSEISGAWVSSKHGQELGGFNVRRFDPAQLRSAETFVAEVSDEIVAFVTWYGFRNGREFAVDLMRRTPDAPAGTMELLLVDGLQHFSGQGCEAATLGGTPLASVTPRSGAIERAMGLAYERGGRYDAKGLFAFKRKFAPSWRPQYLVYRSPFDVPRIARALWVAYRRPPEPVT